MPTTTDRQVGRYRLETLIGKGGMAEVHRARDTRLNRTVAVKTILPSFVSESSFVERFLREARLVAALQHPNILPVYDFGEQDGAPFLVMPYMDLGTLDDRLGVHPLDPAQVLEWTTQLADALDAAHAEGVLHRDVKPSNVLLDRSGRPVLADFGLARMLGTASNLTATGMIVGTPLYMAPELAQGAPATPVSDLYALAVLTYQMLSGSPPFAAESPVAVLHQQVNAEVPPLAPLLPNLPAAVDRFFARALAKDPAARFACGAQFAHALADSLGGADTAAVAVPPPSGSPVTRAETKAVPPAAARTAKRGIVIAALLLAAAAGTFAIVRGVARGDAAATEVAVTRAAPMAATDSAGAETSAAQKPAPPPAAAHDMNGDRTAPPTETPTVTSGAGKAREESASLPSAPTTPDSPPPFDPRNVRGELSLKQLGQQLRRPRRLGASEFGALEQRVESLLTGRPDDPALQTLQAYAAGGLAYVDGDDEAARAAVDRARATAGVPGQRSPLWLTEPDMTGEELGDWQLAVIYGDARGEGLSRVESHLASHPSDLEARMARAVLLHVNGHHDDALAEALTVRQTVGEKNADAAGRVANFVADEYVELGRFEDAVRAYRDAARRGGDVAAYAGLEGGRIALARLNDHATARELFEAACRAGQQQACRSSGRARGEPPRRRRR